MRALFIITLVLVAAASVALYFALTGPRAGAPIEPMLVLPLVVPFLLLAGFALVRLQRRPTAPPPGDLPEGLAIPLRASFTGLAGVPLLALAHNSLNPHLKLGRGQIEFGMGRRRRAYSELARVSVLTLPGTRNLRLEWNNSPFAFTANIATDEWRAKALAILAERGAPLDESARALLADTEPAPRAPPGAPDDGQSIRERTS